MSKPLTVYRRLTGNLPAAKRFGQLVPQAERPPAFPRPLTAAAKPLEDL